MLVRCALAALVLSIMPLSRAAAQTPIQATPATAEPVRDFAPRAVGSRFAQEQTEAKPVAAQPVMASRGSGFGLMIAGGAAFIAGLIIGGDGGTVLALAGAGIGAYGLYLYFR